MNLVQWSLAGSALCRLFGAAICLELNVKLAPDKPNYPNRCPAWLRCGFGFGVAVFGGNCADLFYRAAHDFPPHPLMSGYMISAFAIWVGVGGHIWLRRSWLPVDTRLRLEDRVAPWIDMPPCVRRRRIRDAFRRRSRVSCSPPEQTLAGDRMREAFPPIPADDVIPPALRDAP